MENMKNYSAILKKMLFSWSYFEITQYFKFRKQQYYVHSSAAIVSLFLRVIVVTSFLYNLLNVINRDTVNYSTIQSYVYPPSPSLISFNVNFMVAIQSVTQLNKLDSEIIIQFYQNIESRYQQSKILLGQAQQCTTQHWKLIPKVQDHFMAKQMNNWLCMPTNISAILGTNVNTKINKYLSIEVSCPKCDLNILQPIKLNLHFSNPLINPVSSKDYLSYYINSDYQIKLNPTNYDSISIFMENYTIVSDMSLYPWSNLKQEQGLRVIDSKTQKNTQKTNKYFSQISFRKSSKAMTFHRSFPKIMHAFYFIIGSFIPTVLTFAYFMQPILYSIFQIKFASSVYRLKEVRDFGFATFFVQKLYYFLKNIMHCDLNPQKWEKYQKYATTRNTLRNIMDVQYLYQRIQFLQKSLTFIFKDYQLSVLRLISKDSLNEAHQKFKSYSVKKRLKYLDNQIQKDQTLKSSRNQIQPNASKQDLSIRNYIVQEQKITKYNYQNLNNQKLPSSPKQQQQQNYENQTDNQNQKDLNLKKQEYDKVIDDFLKLRNQAFEAKDNNILSFMIYEELRFKQNDLVQKLQERLKSKQLLNQNVQINNREII